MTTTPVVVRPLTPDALTQDARNRALRTLVQNLLIDVIVAVALAVSTVVSSAHSFSDVDWSLLGFLVGKSVIVTVISFVMRRFGDASGLSTLPPPSDPKTDTGNTAIAGDPVDPTLTSETASAGAVTVQSDPGTPVQAAEPAVTVSVTGAPQVTSGNSASTPPAVEGDVDGDGVYDGRHSDTLSGGSPDKRPPAA